MRTLYIVDINSLMFRAYYGIKQELTAPDGTPVRAVYGVIKMLASIIKSKSPTELVIAYDSQKKLIRREYYSDYKSNRSSAPDDLKVQFPLLKTFVTKAGLESFEIDGYEADDVIATLVTKYKEEFDETIIVTGDKDLMQLVDDSVFVYDGLKDIIYDADAVYEKFGVYPNQILDYLSIVGDASDFVPGIKGIGAKGAVELLKKFKTLDNIYKNISLVAGKKKDYFIESEKNAYLSKKLISLKTDLPISINRWRDGGIDFYNNTLLNFYNKYQLKSLIGNRVFQLIDEEDKEQLILEKTVSLVETIEQLINFIKNKEVFSIHIETTSAIRDEEIPLAIGIATENIATTFIFTENYKEEIERLKPYLESSQQLKISHDAKFLTHVLKLYTIEFQNYFDTMLASYIIHPGEHQHNFEFCVQNYLNYPIKTYAQLVQNVSDKSFSLLDKEEQMGYIGEKTVLLTHLKKYLDDKLTKEGLNEVFYKIDLPLIPILVNMEESGIKLNISYLKELKKELIKERSDLESEIYQLTGENFNINSPKQLAVVLFEKLNLPIIKKTKTGNSTDEEVLLALCEHSEIPKKLLEYREITKLITTYLESLIELAKSERIHTSFNQMVTATGRLSSSNPNLQNIPIRTERGRKIRGAFIPKEGYKMVIADYSQIELRILAHQSKDPSFVKAFNSNLDIHQTTASEIFSKPLEEITKTERNIAKTINFGLIYGMGALKLSKELNISMKEANNYIQHYFEHYSTIKKYRDETLEEVRKTGKVYTLFGRVRRISEIFSSNVNIKNQAERMAFNAIIQGTAADLLKKVMITIHYWLKTLPYKVSMLLQVHDELVFEVETDYAEIFKTELKEKMESDYKLDIPLKVDVVVSDSWEK